MIILIVVTSFALTIAPAHADESVLTSAGLETAWLSLPADVGTQARQCADITVAEIRKFENRLGTSYYYLPSGLDLNQSPAYRVDSTLARVNTNEFVTLAPVERFVPRRLLCQDEDRGVGVGRLGLYLVIELPERAELKVAFDVGPRGGMFGGSRAGWRALTEADYQHFRSWAVSIREAIKRREVLVGMTPTQVVMGVGETSRRYRESDARSGVTEIWCYSGKEVLFSAGRVTRVRESLGPGPFVCPSWSNRGHR